MPRQLSDLSPEERALFERLFPGQTPAQVCARIIQALLQPGRADFAASFGDDGAAEDRHKYIPDIFTNKNMGFVRGPCENCGQFGHRASGCTTTANGNELRCCPEDHCEGNHLADECPFLWSPFFTSARRRLKTLLELTKPRGLTGPKVRLRFLTYEDIEAAFNSMPEAPETEIARNDRRLRELEQQLSLQISQTARQSLLSQRSDLQQRNYELRGNIKAQSRAAVLNNPRPELAPPSKRKRDDSDGNFDPQEGQNMRPKLNNGSYARQEQYSIPTTPAINAIPQQPMYHQQVTPQAALAKELEQIQTAPNVWLVKCIMLESQIKGAYRASRGRQTPEIAQVEAALYDANNEWETMSRNARHQSVRLARFAVAHPGLQMESIPPPPPSRPPQASPPPSAPQTLFPVRTGSTGWPGNYRPVVHNRLEELERREAAGNTLETPRDAPPPPPSQPPQGSPPPPVPNNLIPRRSTGSTGYINRPWDNYRSIHNTRLDYFEREQEAACRMSRPSNPRVSSHPANKLPQSKEAMESGFTKSNAPASANVPDLPLQLTAAPFPPMGQAFGQRPGATPSLPLQLTAAPFPPMGQAFGQRPGATTCPLPSQLTAAPFPPMGQASGNTPGTPRAAPGPLPIVTARRFPPMRQTSGHTPGTPRAAPGPILRVTAGPSSPMRQASFAAPATPLNAPEPEHTAHTNTLAPVAQGSGVPLPPSPRAVQDNEIDSEHEIDLPNGTGTSSSTGRKDGDAKDNGGGGGEDDTKS